MNILLIDNDDEIINLFSYMNHTKHFDVTFFTPHDDICLYVKDHFDIVILDFTCTSGKMMLDHIISVEPKQKIVVLSKELEYSCPILGCDFCQTSYNKVRLLKPLKIQSIASVLKDFDQHSCQYFNKFSSSQSIVSILDDIISHYNGYSYDAQNRLITASTNLSFISEFQALLKGKNVLYQLEDYNKIRILS